MRFLLSLIILLSSGYSLMFAQEDTHTSTKNLKSTECSIFEVVQNDFNCVFSSPASHVEKKSELAPAEKVVEDELVFSRKYLEIHNFSAALFSAQTDAYYFHYLKKRLSFFKHFSNLSSHWSLYVIFRVFRI